jgi:hypothetical protein
MIEIWTAIEVFTRETSLNPANFKSDAVIRELPVHPLGMMNVMFSLEETVGVEVQVEEVSVVMPIGCLQSHRGQRRKTWCPVMKRRVVEPGLGCLSFGEHNSILVAHVC